jgi:hypothetical protein
LRNWASSSLQCLAKGYAATSCSSACCGGLNDALGCCSGFGYADTGEQVLQRIGGQCVLCPKHAVDRAYDGICDQSCKGSRTSTCDSSRDSANACERSAHGSAESSACGWKC